MRKIKFKAAFGDETKNVELSTYSINGGNYHIMIDNFYCGAINLMMDGWHVYFNRPLEYTSTDADILIDMITQVE